MATLQTYKMSDKNEQLTILAKYGSWIVYVLVGLVGKFGWDIACKKKMSWWSILGTGCMAVFVGFISSIWFMNNKPAMGSYCVPVLTLVSRDVFIFLNLVDWKGVFSKLTRLDTKK